MLAFDSASVAAVLTVVTLPWVLGAPTLELESSQLTSSCPSPFSIQVDLSDSTTNFIFPYRTRRAQNGLQARMSTINFNDTFILYGPSSELRPIDTFYNDPPRKGYLFSNDNYDGLPETYGVYFVNEKYFAAHPEREAEKGNLVFARIIDHETCELEIYAGDKKVVYANGPTDGAQFVYLKENTAPGDDILVATKVTAVSPLPPDPEE